MDLSTKSFKNILDTISSIEEIKSYVDLKNHQPLCDEFWISANQFVNFALSSKTGGKKMNGTRLQGNSQKLQLLETYGYLEQKDVSFGALVKIADKLSNILLQSSDDREKYIYTLINNYVNDLCRLYFPQGCPVLSIQEPIVANEFEPDQQYTIEDTLEDNTYNGERVLIEKETLSELTQKLKNKKIQEMRHKQYLVLRDISLLSTKSPMFLLVRMACTHLSWKPKQLAHEITERGFYNTYCYVLSQISSSFNLKANKFLCLDSTKPMTFMLKANSDSEISAEISRVKYRCAKLLSTK